MAVVDNLTLNDNYYGAEIGKAGDSVFSNAIHDMNPLLHIFWNILRVIWSTPKLFSPLECQTEDDYAGEK